MAKGVVTFKLEGILPTLTQLKNIDENVQKQVRATLQSQLESWVVDVHGDHNDQSIRLRGRFWRSNVRNTMSDQGEDRKTGTRNTNGAGNNYQVPEVDLSIFGRHFIYHKRPVAVACRVRTAGTEDHRRANR